MRTIKFRGKDIETGEWIYGDLIQRMGYMPSIMYPYESSGKVCYCECAVKRETVGQFTGLYDVSGKEIYEGDILRFGNSPSGVCEVKWNERITAFCIRFYFERNLGVRPLGEWVICERSIEIIGNIHDNPELLKGDGE